MKESSRDGAFPFQGGGESGERTPLLETPKDMLSKGLEMGVCFHRDPAFGEHGGTLLS